MVYSGIYGPKRGNIISGVLGGGGADSRSPLRPPLEPEFLNLEAVLSKLLIIFYF